jgi:hypothetical protein
MIISLVIMMLVIPPSFDSSAAIDKLEKAYQSGIIKDPIEAIIFLERAKVDPSNKLALIMPMILTFSIPWILMLGLGKLFSVIAPAYNFYWGDYVSFYDKRRSARNIFWTVIVLGIIVSIISTYITRFLP